MTAPVQLDPADLDALIALVKSAEGINSASFDAADVKVLPGAWVRIDAIDVVDVLADGCTRVATTIHLIIGSKPVGAALKDLLPLLDSLCEVLTPTGDVALVGVNTGLQTPLPALAVPFEMRTEPTPEESP